MRKLARGLWPLPLASLLMFGCGGDDGFTETVSSDISGDPGSDISGDSGTVNSNPSGGSSGEAGPAHTLVLSHPITDSITNVGGGFYRRIGKATLTDAEGRSLPDGTVIHLNVVDSIIVTGVIGSDPGDAIVGGSLTDLNPTLADGSPTSFTTAAITRPGTLPGEFRFIEPNDLVLLFSASAQADKRRFVATAPTLMTTLDVTAPYTRDYPNATYPSTIYNVAGSMLGASIAGVQVDGTLTPGTATIRDGLATFRITYPANVNTILTGCGTSAIDTRAQPVGSSRVFVVARHNDSNLTTLDSTFCFAAVAGYTVEPVVTSVQSPSGYSTDVLVCVRDGGDTIRLPFASIDFAGQTGGKAVGALTLLDTALDGAGNHYTNVDGCFTAQVGATGNSGDSAIFTLAVGDGSAEIEAKVQ
jgi:hypothetical protein